MKCNYKLEFCDYMHGCNDTTIECTIYVACYVAYIVFYVFARNRGIKKFYEA